MESKKVKESAEFLRKKISGNVPELLIVLGSGFKAFGESVQAELTIPMKDIPNFSTPKVQGHGGQFVIGRVGDHRVALFDGRIHLYEGYSAQQVVLPIRVLASLGVKKLLLTNAAGGLKNDLVPGEVVILKDHINFTGHSCLVESEGLGPQFVDMINCYDEQWRKAIASATKLRQGVYAGLMGPAYETPAETRMFGAMGADVIGMSTVQEVMAARQMGIKIAALSLVTNLAGGLSKEVSHAEVLATAKSKAKVLTEILSKAVSVSFDV